ncbi:hypothetical protein ACIA5A_19915 [Micromonospora sp. NPDC051300]|uniref:phosphoribosylanthranilate isomerase n=1 Tax=Micromonospora sp. NPDC051300 TaxID=3364286 RepID=UPI003795AA3B
MPLVKVCGAGTAAEVALLRSLGVDLVGVWCGVAGGAHDLPAGRAARVVRRGVAGGGPRPVLVTTLADGGRVGELLRRTGAGWVQLHGWQPPALVRRLKAEAEAEATVVKVLHVRDGRCPEAPLVPAYERAGTDLFLLDALGADGRVGSTGTTIGAADVLSVVARCSRPFLLAGGITAAHRGPYEAVVAHPLFRGVDVDSAARGAHGRFDGRRIAALVDAWGR